MHLARILTALTQLAIAIAALSVALDITTTDPRVLALLIAAQNAVGGTYRALTTGNGH